MADASFVQLRSPFVGTIVMVTEPSVSVTPDTVVVLIESMKMEHPVYAGHDGIVTSVAVRTGEPVEEGTILLEVRCAPAAVQGVIAGIPRAEDIPDRVGELMD